MTTSPPRSSWGQRVRAGGGTGQAGSFPRHPLTGGRNGDGQQRRNRVGRAVPGPGRGLAGRASRRRAPRLRGDPAAGARRRGAPLAGDVVRRGFRRHHLAGRARRPGPVPRPRRGLDHRMRPGPGAAVPQHGRLRPDRRRRDGLRDPRAAGRAPATDPHRRADLVPAVLRTRRRLGPGVVVHPGGARRRRVGRRRPEGLVLQRPGGGPGDPHGPHRRRRPPPQGHLVLPDRHGLPRRRAAPAAPDER